MVTKHTIMNFLESSGIKHDDKVTIHCSLRSIGEIENGKILLVGVGHERNTYLHAVDERLHIPDRLKQETFEITIKDHDGNLLKSPPFHTHFTAAADTCVSEYYPNYKEAFEYAGAVTYSRLGNAPVYCCDARKMTEVVKKLWEKTDHDLCISHCPIPAGYYR